MSFQEGIRVRAAWRAHHGANTFAVAVVLAVLITAIILPGRAQAATNAGAFLSELSSRAIAELTEPGLSEAEKEARFRALIREGFDIHKIGRFVLGRYWRRASKSQREAFLAVFEDMIVYRFLPLFADYSGEALVVGNVRQFSDNPNLFSVSSDLKRPDGAPVQVDWRIHGKDGKYRILDVVAEGVSIAVTLRSEYASVLKQNGGDVAALTEALRAKVATL